MANQIQKQMPKKNENIKFSKSNRLNEKQCKFRVQNHANLQDSIFIGLVGKPNLRVSSNSSFGRSLS